MLALFHSVLTASEVLTERSVRQVMNSVEQAVQEQDAEALVSHFADDAVIILRFAEVGQAGMKYDVQGYQQRLEQAWSMPMQYQYQISDMTLSLNNHGQSAAVGQALLETVTFDGEAMMITETQESLDIINRDGQAKIIRLEGLMTIK